MKIHNMTASKKCSQCDFEIKPPLGKVFSCTDGNDYCASCFVGNSMYGKSRPKQKQGVDNT